MSHLKRRTGENFSDEDIERMPDHGSKHETLDFENAELVHWGLGRLKGWEREVLTLYFINDLSLTEIADIIEVPTGTIKSRLYHAKQSLRGKLEEEINGDA